jgi:hypothetical protein
MTHQAPESPRPAGTVYGRGGVEVRDGGRGLFTRLHPGVTAAVCAGVIAVFALGYGVWRASTGSSAAASAIPATPGVPIVPSSAAASSGPPAPTLAAGSWYLSPAGDPETFVTRADNFATLSGKEKMVLIAVAGLADDTCFSFHAGDGRYLRHFDYRLRFDALGDDELSRQDATFCPEPDQPAGTVRLRSANYPDHVIHRRGTELYIDKSDGSADFAADSSFTLVPQV